MVSPAANDFLSSLLDRNLRILVKDGRIFWGTFKMADRVSTSSHSTLSTCSSTRESRDGARYAEARTKTGIPSDSRRRGQLTPSSLALSFAQEGNIVLHNTYEDREPTSNGAVEPAEAAEHSVLIPPSSPTAPAATKAQGARPGTGHQTWRFVGLITIPRHQAVRVEKEEFVSQTKKSEGKRIARDNEDAA